MSFQLTSSDLRQDVSVIGLVSLAHLSSHFSQLLLPPLFPWLRDAFQTSYAELGFLMTQFFLVSCVIQALSGFWVDRHGPRPVLLAGLFLLGLAAIGFAASSTYLGLSFWVLVAGIGNGVFHPVDYTLINRRVSSPRLGHAYSAHGISGSLGWAVAPAILVPLAMAYSWRVALLVAAGLLWLVLVLVWFRRHELVAPMPQSADIKPHGSRTGTGTWDFLRLPALWLCFSFFFFFAMALSVIQAFAPEASRQLHGIPLSLAAICLSTYMLSSAGGMVLGGFLAADARRSERVIMVGYGVAAVLSLLLAFAPLPQIAVPLIFALMGFMVGSSGPSRDLLIKRATPTHASGRVYGLIYSGLDIGQALSPLFFGVLMDAHHYSAVFVGLAALQLMLVFNARRMAV